MSGHIPRMADKFNKFPGTGPASLGLNTRTTTLELDFLQTDFIWMILNDGNKGDLYHWVSIMNTLRTRGLTRLDLATASCECRWSMVYTVKCQKAESRQYILVATDKVDTGSAAAVWKFGLEKKFCKNLQEWRDILNSKLDLWCTTFLSQGVDILGTHPHQGKHD